MVVPQNLKQLQQRSRDLQAKQIDPRTYVVESRSNPVANHIVTVQFEPDGRTVHARCTCAWAAHQGIACSHVLSALEYMASLKQRTLSFWADEDSARRQKHRTFVLSTPDENERVWITSRNAS